MQRSLAIAALEQRRYVSRVMGAAVLVASLQRSVRRISFVTMMSRLHACRSVIAPRLAAALQHTQYFHKLKGQQVMAAAARRALQQRSKVHALLCQQLQALRVIRDAAMRLSASRYLEQQRTAVAAIARASLAAVDRRAWNTQQGAAARLQAGVRWRVESDRASFQLGEVAMERCSLRERRRKNAQRQPSWKKAEVAALTDAVAPCSSDVRLIWLPCFAADHVEEIIGGGSSGTDSSRRATARSNHGTRQGLSRAGLGDGAHDEPEEKEPELEQYDEEFKLCMGSSIRIARPLSSYERQRPSTVSGSSAGAGGAAERALLSSVASTRPRSGVGAADLARSFSRSFSRSLSLSHSLSCSLFLARSSPRSLLPLSLALCLSLCLSLSLVHDNLFLSMRFFLVCLPRATSSSGVQFVPTLFRSTGHLEAT